MRKSRPLASKDGAFGFAGEVPDMLCNAKSAEGFVLVIPVRANHRVSVEALCCKACKLVQFQY